MLGVAKRQAARARNGTEAWLDAMLASVARDDPILALEDAATCLDVLSADEKLSPLRRYDAISKLDLVARPYIRRLTREYLEGTPRLLRLRETDTRNTVVEHWRNLANGYEECVLYSRPAEARSARLSKALPAMVSRCIRSLGAQLKWAMFCYGACDPALWRRLGALYLMAEHEGFDREQCIVYPDPVSWTCVQREYLCVLMWTTLGADSLTPRQIELVSRLTRYFAGSFEMQAGKGHLYYADSESANPPARVRDQDANPPPTQRYFGPGTARARVRRLVEVLVSRHGVPAEIDRGEDVDKFALVKVLHHLHRHWAPSPPSRGEKRDKVYARVFVVHDFESVVRVSRGAGKSTAHDLPVESWLVKNMSEAGFGAEFPESDDDWPHVGCLVGVRLENAASWGVGLVRRLTLTASAWRYVGVQMLSKSAAVVRLTPAETSQARQLEQEIALYLPRSDARGLESGEVTLLVKTGSCASRSAVVMRVYDRDYPLMPEQVVETGRDFQVMKFRLVQDIG